MKIIHRTTYLDLWRESSAEKRMILLAGPRQAGKTTLAKEIAMDYKNSLYFNWDIISDKKKIIENPTFFEEINRVDNSDPLVIFDEIHKYKDWKNYLKGIYDEFSLEYFFLVSGSGRLDIYQKGGDSLAGRYLMFHLFPFTVSELAKNKRKFTGFIKDPLNGFALNNPKLTKEIWHNLSELSGFPEPFLKSKKTFWRKWAQIYTCQIIYEDIQSLSGIKHIEQVNLLYSLLSGKIASPLSINSLAEDLQVAFDTVKNWLNIFDIFYLTFQIPPWIKRINRAITKEKKLYLFNYPLITNVAHRFENMVALELYRTIYLWNELGYGNFNLHYLRNKEKQEIDFLISNNNSPILLIEAKNSKEQIPLHLFDFQNKLNVPAVQLVNKENVYKVYKNRRNKILAITAHRWLSSLPG